MILLPLFLLACVLQPQQLEEAATNGQVYNPSATGPKYTSCYYQTIIWDQMQ
jgi:hypothetical protein